MKYIEIQKDLIKKYNVTLDVNSTCWTRTHAHVKERRVCKLDYKNGINTTFTFAHEIGHIETTKTTMRRAEAEYYATEWAIKELAKYGVTVPSNILKGYQDYIDMELDRGIRRGGKFYDIPKRLSEIKVN